MFLRARLKLTGLYVLIVTVIVCGFSLFLYQGIQSNLYHANPENFTDTQHHYAFVNNTLSETASNIIFADIFIIVVAAGLSYMLAGKTLEPIRRSIEAQKVFAANASHELRTPLTVMKNDIEVLRRSKYPTKDDVDATLKSNLEEIAHMTGIVKDLLLLARSDNQQALVLSKIDLTRVLLMVTDKIRPLTENRGLSFIYASTGPLMVMGSVHHLERVALNILQNSIDHTPKGGSIAVTVTHDSKNAHVRFTDTGRGIDEKDMPYVFTRFYKGDSSTGTGLGLSIVKEVVVQHRGTISIESIKGEGTSVTVHLPLS